MHFTRAADSCWRNELYCWWKLLSQWQGKHSMKHRASQNLLPLSARHFYVIIICKTKHLSALCRIWTRLPEVSAHSPLTGAGLFRKGLAASAEVHTCAEKRVGPRDCFQQYTGKRRTLSQLSLGGADACTWAEGSVREGRRRSPKRRRRDVEEGGAPETKGHPRGPGPAGVSGRSSRLGLRRKAQSPGPTHRSPGTASWRAGMARSARRSPLGRERRVRAPGRSPSPRWGCDWR